MITARRLFNMENNKGTSNGKATELTGFHRAVPIILTAVAVFIFICFITGGSGLAGEGLVSVLRGLFSFGAYAIPLMIILHAVFYAEDHAKKRVLTRVIFSLITVVVVASIEYTICFWGADAAFDPVGSYTAQVNGGFIGTLIAFPIVKVLGSVGLIIIALAAMALYLAFFFANSDSTFGKFTLALLSAVASVFAAIEKGIKSIFRKARNAKAEKERRERERKSDQLLDDTFFDADNSLSEFKIDDLDISTSKTASTVEQNPTLQSSVKVKSQVERNSYDDEPIERVIITDPRPVEKAPEPEVVITPPHAHKKRELNLDYGFEIDADVLTDDTAEKVETNPFESTTTSTTQNRRDAFGIDASADTVFNSNFDPFDFAKAEKAVAKVSSKAAARRESRGVREIATPVNDLPTAEELEAMQKREAEERERALRLEMFEQRRRELVERAKAESGTVESTAQTTDTAETVSAQPEAATTEEAPSTAESLPTAETAAPVAAEPAQKVENVPVAVPALTPTVTATVTPAPAAEEVAVSAAAADAAASLTMSTLEFESDDIKNIVKLVTAQPAAPEAEVVEEIIEPVSEDVFAKREGETDEEAAMRIAERIAQKNPAYARSANELHTIVTTKVNEEDTTANDSDEPTFSTPEAEEVITAEEITFGIDPDEDKPATDAESIVFADAEETVEATAESDEGVFEFIIDDLDTESNEEGLSFVFDDQTDSAPVAQPEPVAVPEEVLTPVVETPAEAPVVEETVESIASEPVAEEVAAAPIVLTEYSTDITEQTLDTEFSPFVAPTEDIADSSAADAAVGETLELERNMLSPTPASVQEEAVAEEATSDEIVWTESADSAKPAPVAAEDDSEEDDGTVFTFTPDGEDSESDDEDEEEEYEGTVSDEDIEDEESAIFFDEEIPPEEQNPDVIKQREMFPFLDAEPAPADAPAAVEEVENAVVIEDTTEEVPAPEAVEATEVVETVEMDEPPFENATLVSPAVPVAEPAPTPVVAPTPVPVPAPAPAPVKEEPKKPDYSSYEFPPMELLGLDHASNDENVQSEIQENADRLIDTLSSFNVTASIKGVDRGPRITRYEVVPAKGVKVSSIMNLQDDIALSLAADGIRMEAPIPGKSAVGVEIPNKKSSTVRLRELLETDEFKGTKSKTAICIGKDVAGQPVINDISKMPHLLIAGATGMGKSVCINSLLISILYKARPDEVKLIMIDPKQVEFTMYNGIPHLLIPVVSDPKQAAGALMWAVDEMERRYNLLNPLCVRNVDAYNEKVARDPSLGEPMSKIIIVIDEFADLMLQVKDPVENLVMRIAQKARAAGIHLIIGTQRPSTNVITGTIKANIPSRISCKVASNVDSRTVLDIVGAEKLLDRGDMLFAYAGAIKPLRVQGAFTSDSEVEAVMAHLKQFSNGANYDEAVMEEIKRAADKCSKKGSGGGDGDDDSSDSAGEGYLNDRQFLDAVDIAVNSGRLSTALLQRKLSIGYSKAARFIDVMCDMGIISEPNGQKPREVLITADEWQEKLSRTMIDG